MTDMLAALAAMDEAHSGVEATSGFSLHPTFKGIAEVTDAKVEQNSNGDLQLFVKLKTDLGNPAVWITLSGFKSEKAVAYSKKSLLCLGHAGTFLELAKGGAEAMVGRQVEIQVKHRKWEGVDREDVFLNRQVEGSGADSGEVSEFANQFNEDTKKDDDDIPF